MRRRWIFFSQLISKEAVTWDHPRAPCQQTRPLPPTLLRIHSLSLHLVCVTKLQLETRKPIGNCVPMYRCLASSHNSSLNCPEHAKSAMAHPKTPKTGMFTLPFTICNRIPAWITRRRHKSHLGIFWSLGVACLPRVSRC